MHWLSDIYKHSEASSTDTPFTFSCTCMSFFTQFFYSDKVIPSWTRPNLSHNLYVLLLCPDVKMAVGVAAAMPHSTRSSFWSGACLWASWRCSSLGPARTWQTAATTQHPILGRRWSSTLSQVWITVSFIYIYSVSPGILSVYVAV